MKKLTAILVAGVMMMLPIQSIAQGITVSTTETDIIITVDMGAAYANQTIGYELIRPTK